VEDSYSKKCCPICLEKLKAKRAVAREQRKLDRMGQELIEKLKFSEPLPKHLQGFSNYQAYWRQYGKETTWEKYLEDRNKWIRDRIQKEADTQIAKTKGEFTAKKRFLMKFLRFDVFTPSNREECTTYRLQKLGLWHEQEPMCTEHSTTCEGCDDWLYNLMNDVLDSEDGLIVHLAYAKDFENEEDFERVKNKCPFHGVKGNVVTVDDRLKKITVVCNPNSIPIGDAFDLWESNRNLRPVDSSLVHESIKSEYEGHRQQQPQEPRDPFLEEMREHEKQEAEAETEHIRKLDRRKVREWLDQPDED
jgi:hypothetical protein